MGAGIAQVMAASGRAVLLHDAAPGAVEKGLAGMRKSLEKLAAKGAPHDPDEVLARVEAVDELVDADLLVEAVVEDAGVKQSIFRQADLALGPDAVLASNTSSIPIASLAAVTGRPERVIGMHFFNPVPVMALVEVVRAPGTSDETVAEIVALAEELGKTPAEVNDFPGFVSNRILMPLINEAAYALQDGVARGGGDRHDRQARLQPPDGAARTGRPDRARHLRLHHGGAAGRAGRCEARALPPAPRARRRGPPRPQDGPGVLQLPLDKVRLGISLRAGRSRKPRTSFARTNRSRQCDC